VTPEGELKKAIRKYLDIHGIYYANVAEGAFSKPGDPDIIADVNGRFLAIEAKSKTGQLREQQKICRDKVAKSGGTYVVIRSLEELVEAIANLKTI
jgi:Holliday junction resolvase